jgi:hypothetical protein
MGDVEGKHQSVNTCAWESLLGLVVRMGWDGMGWNGVGDLSLMNERTRARSRLANAISMWEPDWHREPMSKKSERKT